jgi:tetratricopeptide (TPR) repeat protein
LIKKVTNDELILIQKGKTSYTDDDCIKYSFVKEKIYQKSIQLKSSDILLANINDTVYKSSEKIYAKFSGDKSFFDFCHELLPEVNGSGYFLSTFIIRKNGIIDSIQILESINKRFEKQFRKALNKSKSFWIPGEFDGQKVDVQMKIEFKYFTSEQMIPMYDYSQKGKVAMNNLDYSRALTYFELALEKVPTDYEIIYYKAICELNLGNKKAACEDLKKVKGIGKMNVDELIKQSCE